LGVSVLHLHTDLPHFAPKLIIDQGSAWVLDHVALAARVRRLNNRLEGRFEVLAYLTRKFGRLLAPPPVSFLSRDLLGFFDL
jgi:hypothetical protein